MNKVLAIGLVGLNLLASGCSSAQHATASTTVSAPSALALPTTLDEALTSAYRTPANVERDRYRHPAETLKFFGLKPDQTVIEIEPGAGWYTEILAPYLAAHGHYVAAINPKYLGAVNWLKAHPEVSTKTTTLEFTRGASAPLAADGTADLVLTFRNCHNWIGDGSAKAAFRAFFRALKPGGVLGVVDHRASNKGKVDPQSGYVREKDVIALATAAGFKLDARSELNVNPKDTRVHPNGVWSLPPSLKGGDVDQAKFLAIGESDRMTLRFVKPAL